MAADHQWLHSSCSDGTAWPTARLRGHIGPPRFAACCSYPPRDASSAGSSPAGPRSCALLQHGSDSCPSGQAAKLSGELRKQAPPCAHGHHRGCRAEHHTATAVIPIDYPIDCDKP